MTHKEKTFHYLSDLSIELKNGLDSFLGYKENVSNVVMACLLTGSNFLLEDAPGVGKTTFVKLISKFLDLDMKRLQCTSDLLPSDLIGTQIYDPDKKEFVFHEGPIFSNILLADELNRSSSKTQSALLQAMEEKAVTIDKKTKILPYPFYVIATQNPTEYTGTFPLPESQMDRFAAKISLNYPSEEKEKKIFSSSKKDPLDLLRRNILSKKDLLNIYRLVDKIYLSDNLVNSMYAVIKKSREHKDIQLGVSTRGGIQWLRLAKAIAFMEKRDFVTPDDLICLAYSCLTHRMIFREEKSSLIIKDLLEEMDI